MDVSIGEASDVTCVGYVLLGIPRHHESIIRMAVATHANATYGDSLSPVYTQNGIPIQGKAKGGGGD